MLASGLSWTVDTPYHALDHDQGNSCRLGHGRYRYAENTVEGPDRGPEETHV